MPYSASTSAKAPNVAVSTASTPASKYSRCIWATRSGRVSTRFSLHPSSASPPKSSAVEVLALDPGAEGPVEDEDARFEGSEKVGHQGREVTADRGARIRAVRTKARRYDSAS